MTAERITINRLTWIRWGRAIKNFAASEVGGRAKLLALALVALLVAINGLNIVNSYVGRDFMSSIEQQNMPRFFSYGLMYIGVFAVSTATAVIHRFVEERLGLLWRVWASQRLCHLYLKDRNYFVLRDQKTIENPDQRIADDVRVFTTTTLSFALMLLNGTFTVIAFSGVLWSISPWLFVVAGVYAAAGSSLTIIMGRPLVWLSYRQSDREATFRAELVHVRENAETVAISRQEGRLKNRLAHRIDELANNARKMIAVNRNLGFFTTGYNYLIQIIPALIVAPLFIRGQAEFGVVPQASMAFSHLVGAFSLIVTQFQSISSYAATIARLSALDEAVEGVTGAQAPNIRLVEEGTERVRYGHLTLTSPRRGRMLVNRLNLDIAKGVRVLVTSAEELGRVALFRATAGIWDHGEGIIVLPGIGHILFVSEHPYLPPGTLRQAVVRAGHEQSLSNEAICEVLRTLDAEVLIARAGGLDEERDWDSNFSLREQQLLAIARVLLAAPTFAFLDRITTTLTPEDVERVLRALTDRSITYVMFGVPNGASAQFDAVLNMHVDGTWEWKAVRGHTPWS
ncbi:MAG: ABC transporter ATP-binding protein/permease [Candidatus Brocadia sp.]|nr:ABC transporter ATP-binding protein/permease [Candidatus Brocadia sp.]